MNLMIEKLTDSDKIYESEQREQMRETEGKDEWMMK